MTGLCSKKRRGFNLIEAAIVLGVVGLVVAGIWAAAVTISEKREINNVKDFVLYSQGLAVKYSQNYPITSSLSLRRIMPNDTVLPGGFKIYYYSPASFQPISENHKLYASAGVITIQTQGGHVVNGSFNWWIGFLQDATVLPWTFVPRPGVCAALLSWVLGYAANQPVLFGYNNIDNAIVNQIYWDSRSGAAPPTLDICQTAVYLDVFLF